MSQSSELPPMSSTPNLTTCSNCHSTMPAELRFCRNCGFRLGEGMGEFTETVRFGEYPPAVPARVSGPVKAKKHRRKMSGMAWIFVGLLIFFVGAAAFTAVISPMRQHVATVQQVKKSYAGTDGWENSDKGVTFNHVNPPAGPADIAGLVGGDVIVTFDGQRIENEDQMNDLMIRTPVGKTVDIVYMRDGETHNTKLTTISRDEFRRLDEAFRERPEGRGQFGFEDGDSEVVEVPGTKIHGVRLDRIYQSRPADMAGIKKGDVVIEFDGIPIRTVDELTMRVQRALPYSTVKVVVMRGEEKLEIPVKMGKQ
jgi:membrane-associated protease RseP (regulator of RpoE activity)